MALCVDVKERLGVIGTRNNCTIELRIVSWNGNAYKYDIRGWYKNTDNEEECTKGISLNEEEIGKLYNIIKDIDLETTEVRKFGVIPHRKQNIIVQLTKDGFDIRSFKMNFGISGVTLSKNEMEILRNVISNVINKEVPNAPKEQSSIFEPVFKLSPETDKVLEKSNIVDEDHIIHSLTSIPVNDGNFPINTATVEQLRKAIEIMENQPNGHHKTRLARCKAKLKSLERNNNKSDCKISVKEQKFETISVSSVSDNTSNTSEIGTNNTGAKETNNVAKDKIITFPKKDTTEIIKLTPSNEHHTYEEAKEKLDKERQMFKGDRDSEYVIDGILEACLSDQEFLDNVMRPEKSYSGAMKYFAQKAKEGYCIRVGNIGIMDANTALKYSIDYFNSDESQLKPKKTETNNATSKRVVRRRKSRK